MNLLKFFCLFSPLFLVTLVTNFWCPQIPNVQSSNIANFVLRDICIPNSELKLSNREMKKNGKSGGKNSKKREKVIMEIARDSSSVQPQSDNPSSSDVKCLRCLQTICLCTEGPLVAGDKVQEPEQHDHGDPSASGSAIPLALDTPTPSPGATAASSPGATESPQDSESSQAIESQGVVFTVNLRSPALKKLDKKIQSVGKKITKMKKNRANLSSVKVEIKNLLNLNQS